MQNARRADPLWCQVIDFKAFYLSDLSRLMRESFDARWEREDVAAYLLSTEPGRDRRCRLAIKSGVVLGFVIFDVFVDRIDIDFLGVSVGQRRRAIGVQLMARVMSNLGNRPKITLQCRAGNETAMAFYRIQGFKATRIMRKYYNDNREDAFEMTLRMPAE